MDEMHRVRYVRTYVGSGVNPPCPVRAPDPGTSGAHQPQSPPSLVLWGFYGAFITKA